MEEIKISNKIYYYLLKHGELNSREEELYKAYSDNENIEALVKELGEDSDAMIKKYGGVIYMIPKEENDFLGFSKGELKRVLCKSGATDKDYYLSQFIILTLLINFYSSQGISSKSRDYIKIGEFLNIISDRLTEGANKEADREQDEDYKNDSGIIFKDLLEKFESLKSLDKKTTSKTTKEGFVDGILRFLDEQGLIYYIQNDDIIKTTPKLDSFMDWNLLNKNNYERVLRVMGEKIDE